MCLYIAIERLRLDFLSKKPKSFIHSDWQVMLDCELGVEILAVIQQKTGGLQPEQERSLLSKLRDANNPPAPVRPPAEISVKIHHRAIGFSLSGWNWRNGLPRCASTGSGSSRPSLRFCAVDGVASVVDEALRAPGGLADVPHAKFRCRLSRGGRIVRYGISTQSRRRKEVSRRRESRAARLSVFSFPLRVRSPTDSRSEGRENFTQLHRALLRSRRKSPMVDFYTYLGWGPTYI
jgi:hypothetical protein